MSCSIVITSTQFDYKYLHVELLVVV